MNSEVRLSNSMGCIPKFRQDYRALREVFITLVKSKVYWLVVSGFSFVCLFVTLVKSKVYWLVMSGFLFVCLLLCEMKCQVLSVCASVRLLPW